MTRPSPAPLVLVAAFLLPRVAAAEQGDDVVECSSEQPCDPGIPCVDGICVAPVDVECSNAEPCDPGIPCVDGVCREEEPEGEAASRRRATSGAESRRVRGFLGLAVGGGFSGFWSTTNGFAIEPAIVAAARAGVLVGSVEVALELAPYSLFVSLEGDHGMGLTLSAGWLESLTAGLAWPLRVGLGLTLVEDPLDQGALFATLQLQADLIGLLIRHGHWLLELRLPSVRYHPLWETPWLWPTDTAESTTCVGDRCGIPGRPNAGVFVFLFTFSVSYAF